MHYFPKLLVLREDDMDFTDEALLVVADWTLELASGCRLIADLWLSSDGILLEAVGGRGVLLGGFPEALPCTTSTL